LKFEFVIWFIIYVKTRYGMNFEFEGIASIPELNWEYGYLYFWSVVLGYFALVAFWLRYVDII